MEREYVAGIDLDGVVADFYGAMRHIAAEWYGKDVESLTTDVSYGLPEWGFPNVDEYKKAHRFAVTERSFFRELEPITLAPQTLRSLSNAGVRIRIITYRLFIDYFHQIAVEQTVGWLDHHGIPYRDLCFMRHKGEVGADVYVDDTPEMISALRERGKDVIVFSNSTNKDVDTDSEHRAEDWPTLERLIYRRMLDVGIDLPGWAQDKLE